MTLNPEIKQLRKEKREWTRERGKLISRIDWLEARVKSDRMNVYKYFLQGMFDEKLTPREIKYLKYRFGFIDGITRTYEEIGWEFGVTRERVRQVEAKAFEKLRPV